MKLQTLQTILFLTIFSSLVQAQNTTSREPFTLEFPGISSERRTAPIIRLDRREISLLKIRILEPFAANTNYGSLVATVNGNGINRDCEQRRDNEGKFYLCDYGLSVGKNIIEVRSIDRKGREFYASYVVILGDKSAKNEIRKKLNEKAEEFTGRKFALIIGVSEYKFTDAGLKNLSYADDDAQAVANFLKTPEGGSYSAADVTLLLNQDASLTAVRATLKDIGKRAKSEDLIFIFIAGHGAPDPLAPQNLYFLFSDTKVVDMPNTAFPMNELKQFVENVRAKRVISLVDTCHSAGVNQKTKSIVSNRDLVQEEENNLANFYLANQLFKEEGRAVITSSDVNEVSQESSKWNNHGVFTWALLEGLKGKADENGDNKITTGELFRFTQTTVQKATDFKQNPRALPGSNTNIILAFKSK